MLSGANERWAHGHQLISTIIRWMPSCFLLQATIDGNQPLNFLNSTIIFEDWCHWFHIHHGGRCRCRWICDLQDRWRSFQQKSNKINIEVFLSCARQTPNNQTTGSEEDSIIEVDCLTNIVVTFINSAKSHDRCWKTSAGSNTFWQKCTRSTPDNQTTWAPLDPMKTAT